MLNEILFSKMLGNGCHSVWLDVIEELFLVITEELFKVKITAVWSEERFWELAI